MDCLTNMSRRSFKSDSSFLEKISCGAIGTLKVIERLEADGHKPIELERGSTSFKIWKKIKIKRIRVPDVLCVDCGLRVESRAKTKLAIIMSHSDANANRSWNYGLKDEDYVALIACEKISETPTDWRAYDNVQYIKVGDMKRSIENDQVTKIKPKGTEEGYESTLRWPSAIANFDGKISGMDEKRIQYKRNSDNRTISLKRKKREISLTPLIDVADEIQKNQIIASVVPVHDKIECVKIDGKIHYSDKISSVSMSERYSAAKSLMYFFDNEVKAKLIRTLENPEEHIYVKLEAAKSLALNDEDEGLEFIKKTLSEGSLEERLEATIVSSEIANEESNRILIDVLNDETQDSEIRSGAAWALGQLHFKESIDALVSSFNELSVNIREESAKSLSLIAKDHSQEVLKKFPDVGNEQRAGISWAHARAGNVSIDSILNLLTDDNARKWVSYIIGTQKEETVIEDIEKLKDKDPEVYFAVTVLWLIFNSWIKDIEEY